MACLCPASWVCNLCTASLEERLAALSLMLTHAPTVAPDVATSPPNPSLAPMLRVDVELVFHHALTSSLLKLVPHSISVPHRVGYLIGTTSCLVNATHSGHHPHSRSTAAVSPPLRYRQLISLSYGNLMAPSGGEHRGSGSLVHHSELQLMLVDQLLTLGDSIRGRDTHTLCAPHSALRHSCTHLMASCTDGHTAMLNSHSKLFHSEAHLSHTHI